MNKKKLNKRASNRQHINEEFTRYNEFMELQEEKEKQKNIYENYNYLSPKERENVDSKFTIPKNTSQKMYVELLNDDRKKIVLATGPAGTGKTLLSTEYGIYHFLTGKYEKLIMTRPNTSVDDEEFGFLPGSLEDKMSPFVRPIFDILHKFISPNELRSLIDDKHIEIAPLAFMRGRTFKNTFIIADEMQNSSTSQMKCLLTRMGENSKVVITGDLQQSDRALETNGLDDFLNRWQGRPSDSISSVEFGMSDIEREEVVREVLDIYSLEKTPDNYFIKGNDSTDELL